MMDGLTFLAMLVWAVSYNIQQNPLLGLNEEICDKPSHAENRIGILIR